MYQEGKTVVVGMSGGVDSSVAAALLHEQGYRVIGLFMKNWEEQLPNGVCQATVDYEDVVNTCNKIQIPHIAVSFSKEYQESVFADFLKLYNLGLTPNPDILCNREIKFKALYEKALELDADYLATGHYCQTVSGKLYKGKDPLKDQSYFLHAIDGKVLEKVLFPVGGIEKPVVRQIAAKYALPTQQKKDSTGICFIGERKFREFLLNYLPAQPGEFRRLDETIVGEHLGVAYYTIGQRRRLGLGGEGERWFVLKKDCKKNIVYVERGDHPALYKDTLVAKDLTWIQAPPEDSAMLTAKIRYRQNDQECRIVYLDATTAKVTFQTPQRAITSGQYVVFYSGDVCLGGGVITDEEA